MSQVDDVAQKLSKIFNTVSNVRMGTSGGVRADGTVSIAGVTNSAIAGDACPAGAPCIAVKEGNQWYARSCVQTGTASEQITLQTRRRPAPPLVTTGPVKVLFSVVNGANQDFYIGGDRSTPIKIWSAPATAVINEAYIANTGKSLNNWIVSIRSGDSYYSITQSGVVATSAVPGNTRLYYRGHGLWSSGIIVGFTQREWVEENGTQTAFYDFNPSVYTTVFRTRIDATGTTSEETRTPAEPEPPTSSFLYSEATSNFSASYLAGYSFLSASATYSGTASYYNGSSPFRVRTFNKTIAQTSETVDLWLNKDGLNATPKGSTSDTGSHESFYSVDRFEDSTAIFDYIDTVSATANGSTILSQSGTVRAFSGARTSRDELHQVGTDAYVSWFNGFPGRSFDVPPLNNYSTARTEYSAYLSGKVGAIAFKESLTNGVNNADQGYYLIEDELEYKIQNSLPFIDFASANLVGRKITSVGDLSSYRNADIKTPVEIHQISVADGVATVSSSQERPVQVFSLRSPDCIVHAASAFL